MIVEVVMWGRAKRRRSLNNVRERLQEKATETGVRYDEMREKKAEEGLLLVARSECEIWDQREEQVVKDGRMRQTCPLTPPSLVIGACLIATIAYPFWLLPWPARRLSAIGWVRVLWAAATASAQATSAADDQAKARLDKWAHTHTHVHTLLHPHT